MSWLVDALLPCYCLAILLSPPPISTKPHFPDKHVPCDLPLIVRLQFFGCHRHFVEAKKPPSSARKRENGGSCMSEAVEALVKPIRTLPRSCLARQPG